MGGPGSGRTLSGAPRKRKYTPVLTQKERADRQKVLAEYAAEHGVQATVNKFEVHGELVYTSLRKFGLRAPRELSQIMRVKTLTMLKRMYIDGANCAVVAAEFRVTLRVVQAVRNNAVKAGFIFNSNNTGDDA